MLFDYRRYLITYWIHIHTSHEWRGPIFKVWLILQIFLCHHEYTHFIWLLVMLCLFSYESLLVNIMPVFILSQLRKKSIFCLLIVLLYKKVFYTKKFFIQKRFLHKIVKTMVVNNLLFNIIISLKTPTRLNNWMVSKTQKINFSQWNSLDPCHPIEFSALMERFCIYAVRYGSPELHVTAELIWSWYGWGTTNIILLNFNSFKFKYN